MQEIVYTGTGGICRHRTDTKEFGPSFANALDCPQVYSETAETLKPQQFQLLLW